MKRKIKWTKATSTRKGTAKLGGEDHESAMNGRACEIPSVTRRAKVTSAKRNGRGRRQAHDTLPILPTCSTLPVYLGVLRLYS